MGSSFIVILNQQGIGTAIFHACLDKNPVHVFRKLVITV